MTYATTIWRNQYKLQQYKQLNAQHPGLSGLLPPRDLGQLSALLLAAYTTCCLDSSQLHFTAARLLWWWLAQGTSISKTAGVPSYSEDLIKNSSPATQPSLSRSPGLLHAFKTNKTQVTRTLQSLALRTRYILVYEHMEMQL